MTRDVQIPFSGAVTYWSTAQRTDRTVLAYRLEALGLGAVVRDRTVNACIRSALTRLYGDRRMLVRPLAQSRGYAVVQEQATEETLDYFPQVTVVNDEGTVDVRPAWHPDQGTIRQAVREEMNRLPGTAVTQVLVDCAKYLGATTLRDAGGVYWVPGESLDTWTQVAAAVQDAAVEGRTKVYVLRTVADESSVEAVTEAFTREIEQEINRVYEALGTVGERGVRSRQARIQTLRERIQRYERVLGTRLEGLQELAKQAETSAAIALLEAQAGDPFDNLPDLA